MEDMLKVGDVVVTKKGFKSWDPRHISNLALNPKAIVSIIKCDMRSMDCPQECPGLIRLKHCQHVKCPALMLYNVKNFTLKKHEKASRIERMRNAK